MNHSQMSMTAGGGDGNTRALVISGWLTGVYFVVELGIGIWTGSVAVLSDAFHTFSAVGGVLIALVAARMAMRPATRFQTFGLIRAEIVGALVNGVFLLGIHLRDGHHKAPGSQVTFHHSDAGRRRRWHRGMQKRLPTAEPAP